MPLAHLLDLLMKNFSTVGRRLVWASVFAVTATAASAAPLVCEFRADAPDQHVVVKGDSTLVVKQVNREWKTKSPALRPLRDRDRSCRPIA